MKKVLSMALSLILALSLAACGQTAENESSSAAPDASSENEPASSAVESLPPESSADGGRVLVAYFSWSGNTEEMASYIAERAAIC